MQNKNNKNKLKIRITTYHFEEEYEDSINGRRNYLSSKHYNNNYEVDVITIRKYY